jgi:hypothetical protein
MPRIFLMAAVLPLAGLLIPASQIATAGATTSDATAWEMI